MLRFGSSPAWLEWPSRRLFQWCGDPDSVVSSRRDPSAWRWIAAVGSVWGTLRAGHHCDGRGESQSAGAVKPRRSFAKRRGRARAAEADDGDGGGSVLVVVPLPSGYGRWWTEKFRRGAPPHVDEAGRTQNEVVDASCGPEKPAALATEETPDEGSSLDERDPLELIEYFRVTAAMAQRASSRGGGAPCCPRGDRSPRRKRAVSSTSAWSRSHPALGGPAPGAPSARAVGLRSSSISRGKDSRSGEAHAWRERLARRRGAHGGELGQSEELRSRHPRLAALVPDIEACEPLRRSLSSSIDEWAGVGLGLAGVEARALELAIGGSASPSISRSGLTASAPGLRDASRRAIRGHGPGRGVPTPPWHRPRRFGQRAVAPGRAPGMVRREQSSDRDASRGSRGGAPDPGGAHRARRRLARRARNDRGRSSTSTHSTPDPGGPLRSGPWRFARKATCSGSSERATLLAMGAQTARARGGRSARPGAPRSRVPGRSCW